ncbi:MAG TPA: lipopolysaccharide biosynthesis protein [Cyanothece sp. UBA12306]|nr:lipopolysaccharide biosynthesis protein [Cyanothece sp. UBA12306]
MKDQRKSAIIALKNPENGFTSSVYHTSESLTFFKKADNIGSIKWLTNHPWSVIVMVMTVMTAGVATWTFKQPPIYQGSFQILLEDPLKPTPRGLEGLENAKIDYATQTQVLASSSVLKPILGQMGSQDQEMEYQNLVKGKQPPLTIKQLRGTKIVEVTFKDSNPEKIQDFLANLSQSYLRYSQNQNRTNVNQGLQFIDQKLPQLQKEIDQRQQQLQRMRQQHNFLSPQQKYQELSQLLQPLQALEFKTQVQLQETEVVYGLLHQQLELSPQEAIAASVLSESPRYQYLLNELQKIEVELAKESTRFLKSSPVITTINQKKANLLLLLEQEAIKTLGDQATPTINSDTLGMSPSPLRLSLQQQLIETSSQIRVLQIRKNAITEEIQTLQAQISKITDLERNYNNLQQEITRKTKNLNQLLIASQQIKMDIASKKTAPWQIISPPEVDQIPIYPQAIKNISLGGILGLVFGIILVNIVSFKSLLIKNKNSFH